MPRDLHRSDLDSPGISRRRHGRGFRYTRPNGEPVADKDQLARLKALVLPPAWVDVWICPQPDGHIQAVGTDAAGRRQYRYHSDWRAHRNLEKHDRVLAFSETLPRIREVTQAHLQQRGFTRDRVLSAAIRLIDLGFFRAGGESYAESNETYGLATLLRDHVTCSKGKVTFHYPAKGSKDRRLSLFEVDVCRLVSGLHRRKEAGEELLAYRDRSGWHDVTSSDINTYLQQLTEDDYSVKDFRTWHATVLAAVGLAVSTEAPDSDSATTRAEARVAAEVAEYLGNTPAVARASYIDPRVFASFEKGTTIDIDLAAIGSETAVGELSTEGPIEDAVRKLLRDS